MSNERQDSGRGQAVKNNLNITKVVILLLLVMATGSRAQEKTSPFEGKEIFQFEPDPERKLTMARKLVSKQRFEDASRLLETLYEHDPDNGIVQNLLQNCYDRLNQYDKAELLLTQMIASQPKSLSFRLRLAEVLVKKGLLDQGEVAYAEATRLVDAKDFNRQMILIKSMMVSHLDQLALDRIDTARVVFGDSLMFAIDRGSILEGQQKYRAAAAEYLPLLHQDTTNDAQRAERRLLALLGFAESAEIVEPELVAVADSTAGARTMRLLADHYLKVGRFDDAFAYSLRLDSLEDFTGRPLMTFMRQSEERKAWAPLAQMAEYTLEQYVNTKVEGQTSFMYARALAKLGRAAEAITVYEQLFEHTPHAPTKGEALYGIGVVNLEYLGDVATALVYFDSVANHHRHGGAYMLSKRLIPRCYLREGRLAEARQSFEELSTRDLPDEYAEEMAYYLALIDLFANQYDSAAVAFRRQTVDYPRGLYFNDALSWLMLLGDAEGSPEAMEAYATAVFLLYRSKTDMARQELMTIVESGADVLADIALFRIAEIDLGQLDSAGTIVSLDQLAVRYPESYYAPLGLKIKADMLVKSEAGREEAGRIYRLLLESHSDYPFASEVRESLRRLQEISPVG